MCDRDFRFLEFQKFKASWVLFNHAAKELVSARRIFGNAYDAERRHERALAASCARADIAAQVVESMRRDVQCHMDESGLLE